CIAFEHSIFTCMSPLIDSAVHNFPKIPKKRERGNTTMKLLYMKPTLWGQKKLGCTHKKIRKFF
ncbi:hypothetical protein CH381_32195, partial [Leptospira sp. mixed culture ATI2-C-A1]